MSIYGSYDPKLARFLSADTVVPGNAAGGMDGVAYRPLTVAFHEAGFAERLNAESAMGLPFQQDSRTRQQAGSPWGPAQPQSLNRSSYVLNNPVKYIDPTGHSVYLSHAEAAQFESNLRQAAAMVQDIYDKAPTVLVPLSVVAGLATLSKIAALFTGGVVLAIAVGLASIAVSSLPFWIDALNQLADVIGEFNGDAGVVISLKGHGDPWGDLCAPYCDVTVIRRDTGNGKSWGMPGGPGRLVFNGPRVRPSGGLHRNPSIWQEGYACTLTGGNPSAGNDYSGDRVVCKSR